MNEALAVDDKQDAPELILERDLNYPVEMVFKAWTDAAALSKWIGPVGFSAPDTEFDARLGGAYVIPMISPDGSVHTARGTVLELVPNERLRISWAWDQEDGSSGHQMELALSFHATADGTRLVLHHTKFIDKAARDQHNQGWTGSIDKLQTYLTG